MPVITRAMSGRRRQEKEHTYPPFDDQVSKGVMMYPVFCTAKIPSEFIDQSYAGIIDVIGDDIPDPGSSPCILQTTDLDSITHGSRKPMPVDFKSPFLHWTDEQVRDWATKEARLERDFVSLATFTILDQNSIDNKICRVGYIGVSEEDADYRMLREVFYADLMVRVPLQWGTIDWDETLLGADGVYDRKAIEREDALIEEF